MTKLSCGALWHQCGSLFSFCSSSRCLLLALRQRAHGTVSSYRLRFSWQQRRIHVTRVWVLISTNFRQGFRRVSGGFPRGFRRVSGGFRIYFGGFRLSGVAKYYGFCSISKTSDATSTGPSAPIIILITVFYPENCPHPCLSRILPGPCLSASWLENVCW